MKPPVKHTVPAIYLTGRTLSTLTISYVYLSIKRGHIFEEVYMTCLYHQTMYNPLTRWEPKFLSLVGNELYHWEHSQRVVP
ncbi:hypothetical protein BK821_12355 [Staphylococcus sp. LCT-H4]|nr:hypothetical protein BK821_12355 [Staphylococcus sp. LCT-H4]